MLDRILNALDATDLTRAYVVLTLAAALLMVYTMNLVSYEHEDRSDPRWLQWVRRIGYLLTAGSLLWSLIFMQSHNWQPWPPAVLLLVGIIVGSSVRVIAIHLRIRREGTRRAKVPSGSVVLRRNVN